MTQQRSMFGGQGGIFGRPLKLAPTTSPLGRSQGVLPQGPAPAPAASFNSKRVPMGNPGDCPICH